MLKKCTFNANCQPDRASVFQRKSSQKTPSDTQEGNYGQVLDTKLPVCKLHGLIWGNPDSCYQRVDKLACFSSTV